MLAVEHEPAADLGAARVDQHSPALAAIALWGFPRAAVEELERIREFEVTSIAGPTPEALREAILGNHDFDVIAYLTEDVVEAAHLEDVVRRHPPRQAVLVVGQATAACFGDSASLPFDVWFEPDVSQAAAIFGPLLRSVREREALTAIQAHRRIKSALDERLTADRDLGDAVADAMGVLARELSCEAASFWRRSISGRSLIRVGCTGPHVDLDRAAAGDDRPPSPDCDRLLKLPVDGTAAGEVLRTGQPRFPDGDETSLLLPARANGRVCGVTILSGARRVTRRRTSFELAESAADRVAALVQWQLATQQFNAVTARSPLAIVLTDANGLVISINEAAEVLCGVPRDLALDRHATELLASEFRAEERDQIRDLITAARAQRPLTIEMAVAPVGGTDKFIELSLSSWGEGSDRRYALTMQDVSARHRAERQIAHLAFTDPVTKLANRSALIRDLQSGRPDRDALVALELAHFDRFVDALGSSAANALLCAAAHRLGESVGTAMTVYHLGGAVFMLRTAHTNRVTLIADVNGLFARFTDPLKVQGAHLYAKVSAGIFFRDGSAEAGDAEVDAAVQALRHARTSDTTAPVVHDPDDPHDRDRLRREHDLHAAIHDDQLRLVYQPIVDLRSGRVHHFEALARWQHPELGLLTPDRFIGLAEENGLIVDIGDWVINEACRRLAEWQRTMRFDGSISFNVAPRQLLAGDLTDRIACAVSRHGVDARRLIAEVVESAALRDLSAAASTLEMVRSLGLPIALDDFGVGESSLGRLGSLPVDILKIDRSLVMGLPDDRVSRAITHSAIHLARELNMVVITEGIETEAQRDHLARAGSHFGQGYLFGRPQPADEAAELLRAS